MPDVIPIQSGIATAEQDAEAYLRALNLQRYLQDSEPLPAEAMDSNHVQHPDFAASSADLTEAQDRLEDYNYHIPNWSRPADEDMDAYRESFRSRLYSPLAWMALNHLDTPGVSTSKLAAKERIAAMESVEGLVELADRYISNNDRAVAGNLPLFEKVTGAERVNQYLDYLAEAKPIEVLGIGFFGIERHVGPERMRELVQAAVDSHLKEPKGNLDKETLLGANVRPMLRPEQVGQAVDKLMQGASNYYPAYVDPDDPAPPTSAALELLQEGLVDEKRLLDGLVALPEKQPMLENFVQAMPMYQGMLERAGRVDEFKASVIKGAENGMVGTARVPDLPFFSDDEKRDLIAHELHSDPEFELAAHMDVLLAYLPEETIRAEIEAVSIGMQAYSIAAMLEGLPDVVLSKDEKAQYLRSAALVAPADLCEHTALISELFDEQESRRVTQSVVANAEITRNSNLLERADAWLPMMGGPEEQRAALRGIMERSQDPGFLEKYAADPALQAIVTVDEVRQILAERIVGNGNLLNADFFGSQETEAFLMVMGNDGDVLFGVAQAALDKNPQAALEIVAEMPSTFSTEQRRALYEGLAVQAPFAIIEKGPALLMRFTTEERAAIVARGLDEAPGETVMRLSWYLESERLPADELRSYLDPVAEQNPALIYLFDGAQAVRKKTELMEYMRSSDHLRGVAPEWFDEFFNDYGRATENGREILMKEAAQMYRNIAVVRQYAPDTLDAVWRLGVRPRDQRDALVKLAFVAKYGEPGSLQAFTSGGNVEELTDATFQTVERAYGISLSEAARRQLEPALIPFTVYGQQFRRSQEHSNILAQFAAADGPEAFRDFRLVANNSEALERAKMEGLLPRNLTLEQHAVWREDEEILSHEQLQASAEDVSSRVRSIIHVMSAESGVNEEGVDLDTVGVVDLNNEIVALGTRLGELRRMHLVNPMMTPDEKLDQKELIAEVQADLARRQVFMAAVRLYSLSNEEVISGRLMNGEGKPLQPLKTILDRAHKATVQAGLPQEAGLMWAEIGQVLEYYQRQTDDTRNVRVVDTIDQQTTLEVGTKPIGSCQDYATGIYRECLLGYTDPSSKIVGVYDDDSFISRSILRLAETDDGTVAIHVERPYTQSASPVVLERTLQLALSKARRMSEASGVRVPVYISPFAQDERDQVQKLNLPEDVQVTRDFRHLQVRGMRAPFVYADSGRGKTPRGPYQVAGSVRLELAA